MTQGSSPKRFYSLDVLRGVAALSVVVWHWQHFFLPFNKRGLPFSIAEQPLYDVLYLFYKNGSVAVQLFFCLSGFIFFWLYAARVADRAIGPRRFSVLRLSRLYPLHFATLVLVAAGQAVYGSASNAPFVYPFNDLYHFVLNLFFASSWGLERGVSFNGPIWSVSVEVLLYAAFFAFCRLIPRTMAAVAIAILVGHFGVMRLNAAIGSGVECFFIGGLMYLAYERIVKGGDAWKVTLWLPILSALAWAGTLWWGIDGNGLAPDQGPWIVRKLVAVWAVFGLFPVTILSLALVETKRGTLGKRVAFIGDASYSSYLLHFPMQLAVILATRNLALEPTLFYSPWALVAFFLGLLALSLASHRYFEVPMQRFLRGQRTLTGGAVGAPGGSP